MLFHTKLALVSRRLISTRRRSFSFLAVRTVTDKVELVMPPAVLKHFRFGGNGLTHTEPLFLQLFQSHLDPGLVSHCLRANYLGLWEQVQIPSAHTRGSEAPAFILSRTATSLPASVPMARPRSIVTISSTFISTTVHILYKRHCPSLHNVLTPALIPVVTGRRPVVKAVIYQSVYVLLAVGVVHVFSRVEPLTQV